MLTKNSSIRSSTRILGLVAILFLPLTILIPAPPASAVGSLSVHMGETLTFNSSQAISPSNLLLYSTDCTSDGYSMQITPVGGSDVLFETTQYFETEHCLNQPSQWLDVFKWDKTSCTVSIEPCLTMPYGNPMASAGEYEIRFVLYLAQTPPATLENTFSVSVLPSYFYTFKNVSEEIYPFKDGISDNVEGSMDFWNETGQWLLDTPKAKIGLKQGSKTLATTFVSENGSFSFSTKKPVKGKLDIVVLSIPNPAGGKKWVSVGKSVHAVTRETKISSFNLSSPSEVYPSKDGYLDSAKISVSSDMTSGKRGSLSGSVKIVKGSTVVKTFPISKVGNQSVTWDGKIGGQIVPGSYVIVASAKGPEGGTIQKTKGIKVSPKKLAYQTLSKTYGAYEAADESQGDSYEPLERYGSTGARFYSSGDGDIMLVKLSVPVNPATVKWRIRFNDWETYDGFFLYNPCRTSDCAASFISGNQQGFARYSDGTTWTPWANLTGRTANFAISSLDYASMYVQSFTVEYVTRVLK